MQLFEELAPYLYQGLKGDIGIEEVIIRLRKMMDEEIMKKIEEHFDEMEGIFK